MRAASGKYLGSLIDQYIAHQTMLNLIVVIAGFFWITYKHKHGTVKDGGRNNFLGLELTRNKKET
jgi:hypothetical protein